MRKTEIIKHFFKLAEEKKWNAASEFLSDYFMISGDSYSPFDKVEFIMIQKNLGEAFPDLRYNMRNLLFDEGAITCIFGWSGTHSKPLHLPLLGVHLEATHEKIIMPAEELEIWVEQDRISDMVLLEHPDGGLKGLLRRIGAGRKIVIQV
jgi:hypothetical protein